MIVINPKKSRDQRRDLPHWFCVRRCMEIMNYLGEKSTANIIESYFVKNFLHLEEDKRRLVRSKKTQMVVKLPHLSRKDQRLQFHVFISPDPRLKSTWEQSIMDLTCDIFTEAFFGIRVDHQAMFKCVKGSWGKRGCVISQVN